MRIVRRNSKQHPHTFDFAMSVNKRLGIKMVGDEEERRTLTELTPQEWNEIRSIAVKLHAQGRFDKDQMKIACEALVQWLAINEQITVEYESETLFTVH